MDLAELKKQFPRLDNTNCRFTSPEDKNYNCIGWAVGNGDVWWEPDPTFYYYWPPLALRAYTIPAYMQAFAEAGFVRCPTSIVEPGFTKVALYAKNNFPTHVTRQLTDGWWTSKLGFDVDIEHSFDALNGG